jgi:hypothetical protein
MWCRNEIQLPSPAGEGLGVRLKAIIIMKENY